MFWYQVRHFYKMFEHLLKVIIIMRAHMVPLYCIRWKEARKKCFKIFLKDSHYPMQIISRHHAEYKCILKTRKTQCFTCIHAQKLTNLSAIWVLYTIIKVCHLILHNSPIICHFRQMSRYHVGDEFT